jgi:AcrR family transcriptional regulator
VDTVHDVNVAYVNGVYLPNGVNDVNMSLVKNSARPTRDGYHHGDLRNALLGAAVRLVAQKGPEAFSLREAAREVGVSPAAAYRHFADKLSLLTALAVDAHGRLAASMEKALARVEGAPGSKSLAVARLFALGEAYVDFAVRHPEHFRIMFGSPYEVEDFHPGCAPSGRDAFQILVDVLDDLVKAGVIAPAARVGAELVAWSGVHGLATLVVSGALPFPPKARPLALWTVSRALLLGLGGDPALLPAGQPISVDPRVEGKRSGPGSAGGTVRPVGP